MKPFLRWAGGKRWIISTIEDLISEGKIKFNKNKNWYFEPFMGSGAVFFELQPKKAVLVDLNSELINLMEVIKNKPEELIKLMKTHQAKYEKIGKTYYYEIRSTDRDPSIFSKLSDIEKAARVLFLNRTCWNGLYRVNSSNQFNTPTGYFSDSVIAGIVQEEKIKETNDIFNKNLISFFAADYSSIRDKVKKGDLIYFDPPYDSSENKFSFNAYTDKSFTKKNQEELKKFCDEMISKGANVIISNNDTKFIKNLYSSENGNYKFIYHYEYPKVARVINSKITARGKVQELLIYSVKTK